MSIKIKRNGEWVDIKTVQDLDTSLTLEGQAADAKAVGDRFDKLPIVTYEQSNGERFTEILGLRNAIKIQVMREGQKVIITTDLEGGDKNITTLSLSEEGYPTRIQTNDMSCDVEWVGI